MSSCEHTQKVWKNISILPSASSYTFQPFWSSQGVCCHGSCAMHATSSLLPFSTVPDHTCSNTTSVLWSGGMPLPHQTSCFPLLSPITLCFSLTHHFQGSDSPCVGTQGLCLVTSLRALLLILHGERSRGERRVGTGATVSQLSLMLSPVAEGQEVWELCF